MEAAQEEMTRQIQVEKTKFADELKGRLDEEMRLKAENHEAEMESVRRRLEEEKQRLEDEIRDATR